LQSESEELTSYATKRIVEGITILTLSELNAKDATRCSREGNSKKSGESDSHSEKHEMPIKSTVKGITIDLRNEYQKPYDSMRPNREFDSNESQSLFWRLENVRISIRPGIHSHSEEGSKFEKVNTIFTYPSGTNKRQI
jgi:hypothetical protein